MFAFINIPDILTYLSLLNVPFISSNIYLFYSIFLFKISTATPPHLWFADCSKHVSSAKRTQ